VKLALIRALLSRRLDAASFLEQYGAELDAFRTSKAKLGASSHIHVDEDIDFELTSTDIDVLCQMYLDDQISPLALEYLTDVLQMSERVTVASPTISDYLFEFGEPRLNGEFTKARAAEIRRAIAEAT
jgi:hypothetical protein